MLQVNQIAAPAATPRCHPREQLLLADRASTSIRDGRESRVATETPRITGKAWIAIEIPPRRQKPATLPAQEHPLIATSMEIVPSGEMQKQFGRYSDEAMIRPVGVSRNGRVRFVMVPVDEYERLRRRERVAGRVEDLDDETLEAIRGVEPGRGAEDAGKKAQRCRNRVKS